jgi:type I restriction enzyme M protein
MEACILICRSQKQHNRKGRVLFIDGRKYVTRQGTESFLTPEQIGSIAQAYSDFEPQPGFSYVANVHEIAKNDFSLAINMYVSQQQVGSAFEPSTDWASEWLNQLPLIHETIQSVISMIEEGRNES